ncbi:hypothetical protein [Hymenobacter baengnokdamensis]|uniref:hypothetical protein n=1 Tax=Hymenobacter baengnokdamensis TaxID=2615203 RepID=UPI0012470F9D|nr:hypothetical protein [Hymenobacter baengnokdamensis]
MNSDNLDNMFRQQLGRHATPPGADLQQRLAALAEAERLDTLFRTGLGGHASPPRRELWERLEDEHLRPQPRRKHRVAAWWHYSAAAILLLLLAGGAGLWRGSYFRQPGQELAAKRTGGRQPLTASHQQSLNEPGISYNISAEAEKKPGIFSRQATASSLSPSSLPIATTTRPRRAATAYQVASSHHLQTRRPDAAVGLSATTRGRRIPVAQPWPTLHAPAAPAVAPAAQATNPPLVVAAGPATPAATPEIIEVEVRRGPEPTRTPAPVVVAAHSAPARPRLRFGSLLRQADHLVHGEAVSLAEATGLPETLTVQARLGGRVLSRTIQL